MSVEDLEYVERATGVSLDDDKPLSDIKRRSTQRLKEQARSSSAGITVETKKYDWFDFFLGCGVNPQICERYAQAFSRDQMGEENLPDVTDKVLRNLGVKEGDILRVMKFLDNKYGRTGDREKRNVSFAEGGDEANGNGGLFSGPGGVLRNNTRKGRPAPPVQTNDVVDPKAFEPKSDDAPKKPADSTATPLANAPVPEKKVEGFEDNAWDVKPSRQPAPEPAKSASPPPATTQPPAAAPAPTASAPAPTPNVPALTGSLGELSVLMPAIKPEVPPQPAPQPQAAAATQPPIQSQPTGAAPSLFDQVAAIQPLPPQPAAPPRMRPQAPQQQNAGGLIAPPPQRASSAPQNPQQSAFGPPPALQPQLTGFNGPPNMHAQIAPPGQSLQDLNMQRMQQQMTGFPQQNLGFPQQNGMMPQPTGMMPQPTGFQNMSPPPQMPTIQQPMQTGFIPQPTGFQQPPPIQPQPTGFQPGPSFQPTAASSPFNDPLPRQQTFQHSLQPQPTGFGGFAPQPQPLNPQATGINRFLPPAIQPTITGMGGPMGTSQSPPPVPPMPPMPGQGMQAPAPLVPQKTGPAPPIRFGVKPEAKKLVPQPTGRANLAKASKCFCPFSFLLFCCLSFFLGGWAS